MSHPSDPNFVMVYGCPPDTGPVGPRVPNNLQTRASAGGAPLPDLYLCQVPACARHVKFGMECPFCFAAGRTGELAAVTKERDDLRARLVEVQAESDLNRADFWRMREQWMAAGVQVDGARETIASLEKAYATAVAEYATATADKVAARQATEEAWGAIRKLKAAMRGLCGDE